MSLENDLRMTIRSTQTETAGAATVTGTISKTVSEALSGSDAIYTADKALAGASESFDLVGALTDTAGKAVTFAKVKMLYFYNKSDAAMTLGGTNNVPIFANVSDLLNVPAGGRVMLLYPTGYTVTAGTGDLITVAGTTGKTFEMVIIGDKPA
jgi:hypothetical protein